MKTIITLGSNCHQEQNIHKAQIRLRQTFPGINFTKEEWTEPIGIVSDRFLNCMGSFETSYPLEYIQTCLKEIEIELGDSHENHQQGIVLIDLDLICYGDKKFKEVIWQK